MKQFLNKDKQSGIAHVLQIQPVLNGFSLVLQ